MFVNFGIELLLVLVQKIRDSKLSLTFKSLKIAINTHFVKKCLFNVAKNMQRFWKLLCPTFSEWGTEEQHGGEKDWICLFCEKSSSYPEQSRPVVENVILQSFLTKKANVCLYMCNSNFTNGVFAILASTTAKVSIVAQNLMDSSPWVQYCIFVSRLQLHYSILLRDNTVASIRCIMMLPPINVQKYPLYYYSCIHSRFLSYSWYLQGWKKGFVEYFLDLFSISI